MRALITGGTSGIGLSTAIELGKAGYDIIITGISYEDGKSALETLKSHEINSEFIYSDSMNEEDVNRCFEKITQTYDSLDVLVNNVGGLGGRQRFEEMETSFMRKVMALNFDSAFFASRAAIPLLKKGNHPSIINYSTIAVTSGGGPGAGIYAASKAAIEGVTRALAKDLAEYGIRVNAVSPGTIDTAFHSATKREILESWKEGILMKRLGEPSEVAAVIGFLASEKASFITGEIIQINGGQVFI
ncbi:SDR family NAD(P)-dependent oxidoreductase [Lacrimispora defluvii]|uniref:SDR family oxidoreductase n=1 Tax=Lacrimispora defluvii TaxID=2719233 RepID=A0ABX1VSK6_9FIRM|nr:SDR family oxidoreductase [Lacrimispora defluvii]NNJ30990.1 SDR family oxidoreductase [Lacrimispora defluvii]